MMAHKMTAFGANCAARIAMRTTFARSPRSCRRRGSRSRPQRFIGSEPDSPIHRRMDRRLSAAKRLEKAVKYAVSLGLEVDVRHRGHEPLRS